MTTHAKPTRICFSGFSPDEKDRLKEQAIAAGMVPVAAVSGSLDYLVAGPGCDPAARGRASELAVPVVMPGDLASLAAKARPGGDRPAARPSLTPGQSLPMPPGVFVAIALETADRRRDSACAIALVRIENGVVAALESSLIRPPGENVEFAHIHGLTWDALKKERPFAPVWASVRGLCAGAEYFIAHNAAHHKDVLAACCEQGSVKPPSAPFVCTLRGVRKAVTGAASYCLADMCEVYGIPVGRHEAMSDAMAAALLFSKLHGAGVSVDDIAVPGMAAAGEDAAEPALDGPTRAALAEFLGVARGFVRDGVLTEEEMACVLEWLDDNAHLENAPYFAPLFGISWRIIEDDLMTDEELAEMEIILEKWIADVGKRLS